MLPSIARALYCSGTNTSHSHDADRHVHFRQRHLDVALLQERRAGVHVDERHRVRAADGRPARISGMRVPSGPLAGLALWPARSTDTIVAPGGSSTFRNGCDRLRISSCTSVSARPSLVINVVATARSAAAASTPASANRLTVERQLRRRGAGRPLIAERRENRQPRQRLQRRVQLTDVDAMQARASAAARSIVPTPSMAISPRSRWMSSRLTTPVSSVKLPPVCARSSVTRN